MVVEVGGRDHAELAGEHERRPRAAFHLHGAGPVRVSRRSLRAASGQRGQGHTVEAARIKRPRPRGGSGVVAASAGLKAGGAGAGLKGGTQEAARETGRAPAPDSSSSIAMQLSRTGRPLASASTASRADSAFCMWPMTGSTFTRGATRTICNGGWRPGVGKISSMRSAGSRGGGVVGRIAAGACARAGSAPTWSPPASPLQWA